MASLYTIRAHAEALPASSHSLNVTSHFAGDWSPDKAADELAANWSDALTATAPPERTSINGESPSEMISVHRPDGVCDGQIFLKNGSFTFVNHGITPPKGYAMLILGKSVKKRGGHGKFGEGLKAAIAIAHRNGGHVEITGLFDFGHETQDGRPILEPRVWKTVEDEHGVICVEDKPTDESFMSRVIRVRLVMPGIEPEDFDMDDLFATAEERTTESMPDRVLLDGARRPGTVFVNGHRLPEQVPWCCCSYSLTDCGDGIINRARNAPKRSLLAKYVARAWDNHMREHPLDVSRLLKVLTKDYYNRIENDALQYMSEDTKAMVRAQLALNNPDTLLCLQGDHEDIADGDIMQDVYTIPDKLNGLYSADALQTKRELCEVLARRMQDAERVELPAQVRSVLEMLDVSVICVRAGEKALRKFHNPEETATVNVDAIHGFEQMDPAGVILALMRLDVIDLDDEVVRRTVIERLVALDGDADNDVPTPPERDELPHERLRDEPDPVPVAEDEEEQGRPAKRRRTEASDTPTITLTVSGECKVRVVRE